MPIKIPSSNIYNKENQKIIDNLIDNVSIPTTSIKHFDNSNVNLKTVEISSGFDEEDEVFDYDDASIAGVVTKAFASITPTYIRGYRIDISKEQKNSFVASFSSGEDRIKHNILYDFKTYRTVGTGFSDDYGLIGKTKTPLIDTQENGVMPDPYISSLDSVYEIQGQPIELPSLGAVADAKVDNLPNDTNLLTADISYDPDTNSYYFYATVLVGLVLEWAMEISYTFGTTPATYVGGIKEYIPRTLTISVNGNLIGIELEQIESTYGKGKKPFSLSGNELMQEEEQNSWLANKIIEQYKNGKETATIRCSISDYYDYDSGDKVIAIDNSTKKMSFNIGDQVIPMVYGADGKDKPMSNYQDGTPKVFQVLGSKIFYDGAVWQELSLQELDKSKKS